MLHMWPADVDTHNTGANTFVPTHETSGQVASSSDYFDGPHLPSCGCSMDNAPQDAYLEIQKYNPSYQRGGTNYPAGYGRGQAHPEDICCKCYRKPTAAVRSHRAPDCHLDFRRREDTLRIIQNLQRLNFGQKARVPMESYQMAKGILTEETKALSGPIQKILPPASENSTVTHDPTEAPHLTSPSTFYQVPPLSTHTNAQTMSPAESTYDAHGDKEVRFAGSSTNYKVNGWISQEPSTATRITMILDTGAGPNFIATMTLRLGWEKYLNKRKPLVLRVANGQTLKTHGFVP